MTIFKLQYTRFLTARNGPDFSLPLPVQTAQHWTGGGLQHALSACMGE